MSSAIVTGATGILGREIVDRLAQNPEQWKTIYAISRSQRDQYPPNIKHGFIAKDLQGVEAEYVFFAAYLQKDSEKENWDANGDMLRNFLAALEKTGAADKIKRILLITGAKQYGVHRCVPSNPMEDSEPWHREDPPLPPIFYNLQQDILRAFCERHPNVSWTVKYPNDVIGFAKDNYMRLATTLGIYAAITRELGRDLEFPGSETFYTKFDCFTSARLHAEFCEGLERDAFDKATWSYLGFVLGRNFDLVISMSKAREMGWTGWADTWQSLQDFFGQLETEKILPRAYGYAR
ncbi:NAD dependent epimerase/dehydratase [Colletotrichum graminicola]|uniref:NAD dependent epimerase/dehydratase n=1 Tax=Colletotrichum graminicola (strain M1.001 / M2 / FGSC 10212) TaxID=645133 RepID=E3Q3P8_COLGM|nr:NAD dependent epimerase/dehydratase [Colletotrichum graminicola M1.001]EFQ25650.1 NAD dependent epimerase/dehydratase [Colletotrichum graminicola M1.001]WDK11013.1 NAD dependent epimerase/dehydratase [Colletotrichum graminicola]